MMIEKPFLQKRTTIFFAILFSEESLVFWVFCFGFEPATFLVPGLEPETARPADAANVALGHRGRRPE